LHYSEKHYYRDPTSIFFDPSRAYKPNYSVIRREQAQQFVKSVDNTTFLQDEISTSPALCIGISSVARPNVLYVDSAIGSLLEGLTAKERQNIHFILFIANIQPEIHPLYNASWVRNVVDEVITWKDANPSQTDERFLQNLGDRQDFVHKGVRDYTHVLQACERTKASFVVTFEDDIIALD